MMCSRLRTHGGAADVRNVGRDLMFRRDFSLSAMRLTTVDRFKRYDRHERRPGIRRCDGCRLKSASDAAYSRNEFFLPVRKAPDAFRCARKRFRQSVAKEKTSSVR